MDVESASASVRPATCRSAARIGPLRRVVGAVSAVVAAGLIGLVRAYQVAVAPLLIGSCKFAPTCSEYFIEAVRTHGCARGALMGMWRICRCHPFSAGGIDPVPPAARSERPPAE